MFKEQSQYAVHRAHTQRVSVDIKQTHQPTGIEPLQYLNLTRARQAVVHWDVWSTGTGDAFAPVSCLIKLDSINKNKLLHCLESTFVFETKE